MRNKGNINVETQENYGVGIPPSLFFVKDFEMSQKDYWCLAHPSGLSGSMSFFLFFKLFITHRM